jgi:hypothetical protein
MEFEIIEKCNDDPFRQTVYRLGLEFEGDTNYFFCVFRETHQSSKNPLQHLFMDVVPFW